MSTKAIKILRTHQTCMSCAVKDLSDGNRRLYEISKTLDVLNSGQLVVIKHTNFNCFIVVGYLQAIKLHKQL